MKHGTLIAALIVDSTLVSRVPAREPVSAASVRNGMMAELGGKFFSNFLAYTLTSFIAAWRIKLLFQKPRDYPVTPPPQDFSCTSGSCNFLIARKESSSGLYIESKKHCF